MRQIEVVSGDLKCSNSHSGPLKRSSVSVAAIGSSHSGIVARVVVGKLMSATKRSAVRTISTCRAAGV